MLEKILAAAKEKGVSQTALERLAALPTNRIAKWKAGTGEPSFSETVRLASVLDLSLNYLADLPETPQLSDDERAVMLIVRSIGTADSIRRLTAPTIALPQSSSAGSTRVK